MSSSRLGKAAAEAGGSSGTAAAAATAMSLGLSMEDLDFADLRHDQEHSISRPRYFSSVRATDHQKPSSLQCKAAGRRTLT